MSALFKVTPVEEGYYQFHLLNGKGEMLLISPEFENRDFIEKAIQEVRVGSLMSQQIAKAKTAKGEMFFLIKDSSGTVIAKSDLFDDEMRFDNALHSVKENACIAEIAFINA